MVLYFIMIMVFISVNVLHCVDWYREGDSHDTNEKIPNTTQH